MTCTIAEISENGLEVSVGDNLKGFIKKNDLSRERADQKTDRYGVGDKVDATVTNIDKKTRKITLSIKAREIEEEKKAMAEYGSSDSGASLGDILGAALAKKDENSSRFVSDIDLTLTVGKDYDGTKTEAKFENGLLTLLIDKKADKKRKSLKISY